MSDVIQDDNPYDVLMNLIPRRPISNETKNLNYKFHEIIDQSSHPSNTNTKCFKRKRTNVDKGEKVFVHLNE